MGMILFIDTSDHELVRVGLKSDEKLINTSEAHNKFGSQVLLGLIQKTLSEKKLDFKDLTGIEVATGPGSFTGLRVGVAVANALGYSLHIPVNGKHLEIDLNY